MSRWVMMLFRGMLLTMGALFFWQFCLQSVISYQNDANDQLSSLVTAQNKDILFLKQRQLNAANFEGRLKFIAALRDQNVRRAPLLMGLGKSGMAAIQWHRLRWEGGAILLEGDVRKEDDLVNFMQKVAQSPLFLQPVILSSQPDTPYSFRLKIRLRA